MLEMLYKGYGMSKNRVIKRVSKIKDSVIKAHLLKPDEIFSGDYSRDMWDAINNAKTKDDLRWALYFVCCRLQELESRIIVNKRK